MLSKNSLTKAKLEELYREFEVPLYNFALRWTFNESLSEEFVQESFMKIWKDREDIRIETVKSLLFRIVQSMCINHFNREKVYNRIQKFDILSTLFTRSFEDEVLIKKELQTLKEGLEKVPFKYRQVLLLSYFGEFSYCEMATILKIKEGTVASRKNRAIEMLKSYFEGELSVI